MARASLSLLAVLWPALAAGQGTAPGSRPRIPESPEERRAHAIAGELDQARQEVDSAARERRQRDAFAAWSALHAEVEPRLQAAHGDERVQLLSTEYLLARAAAKLVPEPMLAEQGLDRRALLDRSFAAARESGRNSYHADAAMDLGEALAEQDPERARALWEAALMLDGIALVRPLLLADLARLSRDQGRWQEAHERLEAMAACLPDSKDPKLAAHGVRIAYQHARYHGEMADYWLRLGVPDEAWRELRKQETWATRAGAVGLGARLSRLDYLLAIDDEVRALEEIARLEQEPVLLTELRAGEDLLALRKALALGLRAQHGTGDVAAADAAFRSVMDAPGLSDFPRWRARTGLLQLHVAAGNLDQAAAVATSLPPAPRRETAIYRAMQATLLAWLALDAGADRAALARHQEELETVCREFLAEWDRTPVRPGGVGFLHFEIRRDLVSVLVRVRLALDASTAALESALELLAAVQARESLTRSLGRKAPSLSEARQGLLARGEGLLVFLVAPAGSHAFAVDAATIRHVPLPSERKLAPWLAAVRKALTDPERARAGLAPAVDALRDRLLPAELEDFLRSHPRTRVVGAELLGVPLEALRLRDGSWLGATIAVSHLPSVPAGLWLRARPATPAGAAHDVTLLACPRQSPAIEERFGIAGLRLPTARLHEMLAAWPAGRTRVLVAEQATRSALEVDSPILQLLVHGVHVPTLERTPALVLAEAHEDPGLLICDQVEKLAIAADLVLLTACAAGSGPTRKGDDTVAHMGGAFLRAGARTVVVSSYDQSLLPVVTLSTLLHRELATGRLTPAEAMTRARAALAREPGMDPWHHVLLRVIGLDESPPIAAPGALAQRADGSGWNVALPAAALVLLVAAGICVRFAIRRRAR